MSTQINQAGVTGKTVLEAEFEHKSITYQRWTVTGILFITVVGIILIPFRLVFSLWYSPEFLRRLSARLTSQTLEIRKGVFFRTEATIPLNRITDLRLHDGPLMRYLGPRGLKVETAGMSGDIGSEGNLIGVADAVDFRDAVLLQRQKVLGAEDTEKAPEANGADSEFLIEIRDILKRIEEQGSN